MRYVVLHVYDNDKGEGWMPTYAAQIATIQEYASPEEAACSNVGNHPEAKATGKPYRVVVIEESAWQEFQVYSESTKGRDDFVAYPNTEDRTIS